jgi:hypothetical protein
MINRQASNPKQILRFKDKIPKEGTCLMCLRFFCFEVCL